MKTVIKVFWLYILIYPTYSFSCSIKSPVVSLSGPVTMLLEEFNLLEDPNLKSISTLHKTQRKFKGEVVAGGIFLAKKTLKSFIGSTVFFDRSKELSRIFKRESNLNVIEVKTVGQDSFTTIEALILSLDGFLSGCEKRIKSLREKVQNVKMNLKVLPRTYLFYLGKITNKYPELLITNDGPIKSLLKIESFKTYPSELAYTPWSKKIISQLEDKIEIGLFEIGEDKIQLEKIDKNKFNIGMRGALTPGIRQIYLLEFLSSKDFINYVD